MSSNDAAVSAAGKSATGFAPAAKYLTFKLGDEEYGLEILEVREIIGLMDITPVPRMPDFVRGVINLRGRIIPVINLRAKFGMEVIPDPPRASIIVVDAEADGASTQMGILVDAVCEVLNIEGGDIEPAPVFGGAIDTGFIRGIAKSRSGVKILLETHRILNVAEARSVGEAADEGADV